MAMTSASMAQKIEAALTAAGFTPGYTIPQGVITALCEGIINEIQANAVVTDPQGGTGTVQ